MPKLSIIVPVYNTEKYLEKCLNSLVHQTLEDIEIIVINDGSTDNSKKIIENFCARFPNKIISFNKNNGGLSDARNYGIQKATGKYLGFVDSDDYVEPMMYEEMFNLAEKNNSDFVECDFSWIFPKTVKNDLGAEYQHIEDYFIFGRVMACNKIYKAATLRENDILFPYGLLYEDIEFFYKLIPYVKKSSYLNKVFYYYVQRDNSIINVQNEKTNDIFTILNNLINYYKENNLFEKYKQCLEYLYIRLLLGSSFLRILKIKEKSTRQELINKTYTELFLRFPNWKQNIYLNKNKSIRNIYYKSINKFTYKIYSKLFRFF